MNKIAVKIRKIHVIKEKQFSAIKTEGNLFDLKFPAGVNLYKNPGYASDLYIYDGIIDIEKS